MTVESLVVQVKCEDSEQKSSVFAPTCTSLISQRGNDKDVNAATFANGPA